MDTPTKTMPQPKVEPSTKAQEPLESPHAFYAKLVKRPDIRELLTRLAKLDKR